MYDTIIQHSYNNAAPVKYIDFLLSSYQCDIFLLSRTINVLLYEENVDCEMATNYWQFKAIPYCNAQSAYHFKLATYRNGSTVIAPHPHNGDFNCLSDYK